MIEIVIMTVEKILNKRIEEDGAVIEGLIKSALKNVHTRMILYSECLQKTIVMHWE